MTWYVAITNPNCHRRAEAELAALGYRSFWPRLRKWVSHARTKTAKEYPILGRYMFVEVQANDDGETDFWTPRNVNGIEAFVTYTNADGFPEPVPVPSRIVTELIARYMQGEWDYVANETGEFMDQATGEILTRKNPIPVGAIVRIMEGEFANTLAIVRNQARGKLKLLPQGAGRFISTWPENVRAA
jgi:transcription antitermination factor NusG